MAVFLSNNVGVKVNSVDLSDHVGCHHDGRCLDKCTRWVHVAWIIKHTQPGNGLQLL